MVAIALGTVAVNALNDYTGSLSLLAAGIRVPRVASAFVVAVLGFLFTLYLNSGDFAGKFEGYLLFLSYWIAPWAAVVLVGSVESVGWWARGRRWYLARAWRGAAQSRCGRVTQACPASGTENPADNRYCANCGAELTARCRRCGSAIPAGARFCPNCGEPVGDDAGLEERKVASVLFV